MQTVDCLHAIMPCFCTLRLYRTQFRLRSRQKNTFGINICLTGSACMIFAGGNIENIPPRLFKQQMQQMLAGKNYTHLLQMADNAARERGTTVEQMAQQLGLPFRR